MANFKRAELILSGNKIALWFRTPNVFGVILNDVVEKWLADTEKDFSAQSLVDYINKKLPGCAMTEKQFSEIPPERKRYKN